MKVVPGSDWTTGLNSASTNTLTGAQLLASLGASLRDAYDEVVRAPLPDELAAAVERLRRGEHRGETVRGGGDRHG
jgi:hypothetical protein